MTRLAPLVLLPEILMLCPSCFAQSTVVPRVGWEVFVACGDTLPEITVGVDDGSGFQFETLTDNNDDGIIRLPRLPVASQHALGVHPADGGVAFHIFDLLGADTSRGPSAEVPLFITAEEISGSALGTHYKPLFAFLVEDLDNRINVIDGRVNEWPNIRFVDASNAPDLKPFVQFVHTLPNFNGEVVFSDVRVQFTFVPEPSAVLLLVTGAMGFALLFCRGRVTQCRRAFLQPALPTR